ncbi:metallophosphoesterase [Saccharothrix xinjiangensis]|uniref:Metallophosphoesterase n=1 Tax=Saccharothrix xinjiangensis TaxID=204798 RepID=A0ABV9YCC2_9PSEU
MLVIGVVTAAALTAVASSDHLPAAWAATATFTPTADTYVDGSAPGTNHGTSGRLGVDGSPVKRMFLRFSVSGLSGSGLSGSGDSATAALLDGIPGTVFTTDNHDYNTSGATGYYNYFGSLAGPAGQGYYSYDLGNWHVVSRNSNISTAAGSAQERWLRADLAPTTRRPPRRAPCSRPSTTTTPTWCSSGTTTKYERFVPQNPNGGLDTAQGIRTFVAGMGGASHYSFGTIRPNSEVRDSNTYGVLKLTLHSDSFSWQFVPEAGKTFTDSGSTACH